MKNLLKRAHYAIYILLLLVLFSSCKTHVEIEEYTTVEKYCEDTYYVGTRVWVRDWRDMPISLEMCEQDVVKYSKIDSVRGVQRVKADRCRIRIERCLKH